MEQNNKSPEDPDLFTEIKGIAKESFNEVRKDINSGVDATMRGAHAAIGMVKDGYKVVEDTVGRERLWGLGFGAKVGGVFAATKPHAAIPLYVAQIGIATIVGAAAGFAAGPWLAKRYSQANGIESNDNADIPPPAPKPEDPAP
jgi:hypothetical protein